MDGEMLDNVGAASTLIGAMVLLMCLTYLTNNSDKDIRRYSYEVISQTIAIFCAVMIFQYVNDVTVKVVNVFGLQQFHLVVQMCQMLVWYGALEFHLYYMSFQGAIVLAKHKLKEVPGMRPSSERVSVWTAVASLFSPEHVMLQQLHPLDHIEDLQSQMTCWKVLLSHVAGFAAINSFGTLQQMDAFCSSWQMSAWIVVIAAISLLLLQWYFDEQRRRVAENWKTFSSLYDDRMEDLYHECYVMWHEEAEEPEDNVLALTLSFLTVQTVRFWISGYMPDVEGLDSWAVQTTRSFSDIETLLMAGALFCAGTVALDLYAGLHINEDGDGEEPRTYQVALASFNQAFAWCMYFGCKWLVATQLFVTGPEEKMILHLILAALVTFIAVVAIWVLDKLADLEATGEDLDHAIIQVIGGNSILVGFAWEQCFDRAIEVIAAQGSFFRVPPLAMKLALAAACICIIVPAWRRWILPMVLREGWKFGFVIDGSDPKWGKVFKSKRWRWLMHRAGIQVIGFKRPSLVSQQRREKNHGMAFQKRRQERGMFKILQKEKALSTSDGWPDDSPAKENGLKFVYGGGRDLTRPLLQDSEDSDFYSLDRSVEVLHRQILHLAEVEASNKRLGPEMRQLTEKISDLATLAAEVGIGTYRRR